jgi:excisionase family DNA binding protein
MAKGNKNVDGSAGQAAGGAVIQPAWYTTREVAVMLRYSLTKTKRLVLTGELRSIKDGGSRRILPEYVAEYVARKAQEANG